MYMHMHLLVGVGVLFALLFKNKITLNAYMHEIFIWMH